MVARCNVLMKINEPFRTLSSFVREREGERERARESERERERETERKRKRERERESQSKILSSELATTVM